MTSWTPLLFLLVVCLPPGLAIARRLGGLPRDAMLRAGLVGALGLSVSLIVTGMGMALGVSIFLLPWLLLGQAVVCLPLCLWPRVAPVSEPWENRGLALLILPLLALFGWYQQGAFSLTGDGPELVAYLREILRTGLYFPTDTHFIDAGRFGEDIRKGLFHPLLAAVAHPWPGDLLALWRHAPVLFAPLPFLGAYGAVRLFGFSRGPAFLAGWLLVVTFNGGLAGEYAPLSSNPKVLAAALFWLATGLHLFGLRNRGWGAHCAGSVAAVAAALAHPMILVFLAAFYGSVLLWTLATRRGTRRLLLAMVPVALILGPFFALRYQSYDPANPIHLEVQGMLTFDGVRVYSPLPWIRSAGLLTVPAYGLVLVLLWRRWGHPAAWWAWAVSAASLMLAFNPALVPVAYKFITYLVFRLPWMLPAALAIPILLVELGPSRRRLWSLALLALFFVPTAVGLVQGRILPRSAAEPMDAGFAREAFASLDRALPPRSIIAADPTTSYLIPALTGHKVICTFDQHGTPNDARALERITTAREILSPALPAPEAWLRMDGEGADYVLLWRHDLPVLSMYWHPSRAADSLRAAQLEASPFFERVPVHPSMTLFERVSEPPAQDVFPDTLRGPEQGYVSVAQAQGLEVWASTTDIGHVQPGDTFRVSLQCAKTRAYEPAPVRVVVRMTALHLPGGDAWGGKLWRKTMEAIRGEEYQTRATVALGGGMAPPSLWEPGEWVAHEAHIRVPKTMRPGAYRLEVTVARMPAIPNYSFGDYLNNRDMFSGAPFDTLWVDPLAVD